MAKLKEEAENYESPKTKNIADLEVVSLEQNMIDREGKKKDGSVFKYKVVVVNGEDYRVPSSVLEQIQEILKEKPELKTIKVSRKGEGLNTKYTVIQLE